MWMDGYGGYDRSEMIVQAFSPDLSDHNLSQLLQRPKGIDPPLRPPQIICHFEMHAAISKKVSAVLDFKNSPHMRIPTHP